MNGVGKDYVLLAHVCGDSWWCHPGCPSGIFGMEQAVVLNVKADAWVKAARPRRRRRAQQPRAEKPIERQAREHSDAFAPLVAAATWDAQSECDAKGFGAFDRERTIAM